MFSLKIRKSFQTTPGNDVEFELGDVAHSGQRQVEMPCPWATGAINYNTTPSPTGSIVGMAGTARNHSIGTSDTVTAANAGDGVANTPIRTLEDIGFSDGPSGVAQSTTPASGSQLPTYRCTSSLLNPTRADQEVTPS
ncbi:hypothetical protein BKA70DRAFT_1560975 [Coprinopsis sp. MPI-PUGE-AT-0042]|nr:hypothetical protein BKA70DRAFT_1560975 [Coprinopsis sp. MPI-PUGE-AT-0042]